MECKIKRKMNNLTLYDTNSLPTRQFYHFVYSTPMHKNLILKKDVYLSTQKIHSSKNIKFFQKLRICEELSNKSECHDVKGMYINCFIHTLNLAKMDGS